MLLQQHTTQHCRYHCIGKTRSKRLRMRCRYECTRTDTYWRTGTWCHWMVACKKDGKSKCTVDLRALNAHATRDTHHIQSELHQSWLAPDNTRTTVLDARNGYHSVPIRSEPRSHHLHHPPGTLPLPWSTPGIYVLRR